MSRPLASIIIPAKNEGRNVFNTVRSVMGARNSTPCEIIVIDDGSEDGCCDFLRGQGFLKNVAVYRTPGLGSAAARNVGAGRAGGEILIFCDAHIFVEQNWVDRLVDTLLEGRVDAVCPAIAPHDRPNDVAGGVTWDERLNFKWLPRPPKLSPVPLLPGGCFAVRADVFGAVGGFERGFMVWGREDEEISLKMWLFGYRLGVNPFVKVLHVFRRRHPYTVAWEHVDYNLLRMAYSHFKNERVAKTIDLIRHHSCNQLVERRIHESDVFDQRKEYFRKRKRDDDWFFERFRIPF
ncbi:MAG: glycosyltransferase [Bacillota bacterium]